MIHKNRFKEFIDKRDIEEPAELNLVMDVWEHVEELMKNCYTSDCNDKNCDRSIASVDSKEYKMLIMNFEDQNIQEK